MLDNSSNNINDLYNIIKKTADENTTLINRSSPPISPQDVLLGSFNREQSSKFIFRIILIIGLLIFLFVQLVFMNKLYYDTNMSLLLLKDVDKVLALNFFDLYSEILDNIKFYIGATLSEFIAMLYFIVRWGFDTTIQDLFSGLFKKNKRKKK